jgi:predicted peptidase
MKGKSLISRGFLSVFLLSATIFTQVIPVSAAEIASRTFNFTVQNEVTPYDERTKAVIIDAGTDVDASTISVDDFAVSARNTYNDGKGEKVFFDGSRQITKAYVAKEDKLHAASASTGRYIVLELNWDVENNGSKTCTGNWACTLNYSIQLKGSFSFADNTIADNAGFVQSVVVDPVIDNFQKGNYQGIPYRAYFNNTTAGPLPLVIFFHGGGQGNDNDNHIKTMNGATTWANAQNQAKHPCHVLAPVDVTTKDKMDKIVLLVKEWIAQGKVDPSRIYVTGYSMGGASTWNFIRYNPDFIAAAVPICVGSLTSVDEAKALSELPIWDFVCKEDFTYAGYIKTSKIYAPYLKNYKLSVLEHNYLLQADNNKGYSFPGHCEWIPVYSEYNEAAGRGTVIDWMFAQKRQDKQTFTFDLLNKCTPYDEHNYAVVIDAEKDVDAASIDTNTFSVIAHNTYIANGTEKVGYDGPRKITKVYVNDKPEATASPTNSGHYIVVELECVIDGKSDATYFADGWASYAMKLNYTVTQNADIKYSDSSSASAGKVAYMQALTKNPVIDKFQYEAYGSTKFRLYTPEDTTKKQPLVIFFHGMGQGFDNEAQMKFSNGATRWAYPENQAKYPCYIAAIANGAWGFWPEQPIKDAKAYAEKLIAEGKVDPDRVYVTGYSAGGGAVWTFARLFPDFPAAIAPLTPASGLNSISEANAVADLPVWSFITKEDPNCWNTTMDNDKKYSKYLKDYKLTILENNDIKETPGHYYWPHCCWVPVYNEYTDTDRGMLQDWMFSKNRAVDRSAVNLNGPSTVIPNTQFNIEVSLSGKIKDIYAEDITVNYDASKYDFVAVNSSNEKVLIGNTVSTTPGVIRIIAANTNGLNGADKLFNLTFRSKDSVTTTPAVFMTADSKLGDPVTTSNASLIGAVDKSIQVSVAYPAGDINHDGICDVADLAKATLYYNSKNGDANWNEAKTADVNSNGKVDIVDLATIARNIQ